VVSGVPETRRQILLYSGLLIPIGAAPWLMGYAGLLYGVTALAAGAAMTALACRLLLAHRAGTAARIAGRMFAFSIFYLFILFAALLIDDRLTSLFGRAA
jgi:protoheme IX farnesyltransferase